MIKNSSILLSTYKKKFFYILILSTICSLLFASIIPFKEKEIQLKLTIEPTEIDKVLDLAYFSSTENDSKLYSVLNQKENFLKNFEAPYSKFEINNIYIYKNFIIIFKNFLNKDDNLIYLLNEKSDNKTEIILKFKKNKNNVNISTNFEDYIKNIIVQTNFLLKKNLIDKTLETRKKIITSLEPIKTLININEMAKISNYQNSIFENVIKKKELNDMISINFLKQKNEAEIYGNIIMLFIIFQLFFYLIFFFMSLDLKKIRKSLKFFT